jgi:hypothetical protein
MALPTIKSSGLGGGGIDTLDLATDQRKLDVLDQILLLEPDKAPLVTLLARMRKKKAMNPKFEWLDDVLLPKISLITDVMLTTTDVTFTVTTGDGVLFKAQDLWRNVRTGEVYRVVSIATDIITVAPRPFAGPTPAGNNLDTAANDEIICIGTAMAENSNAPNLVTTVPANQFNFTQIFRTPFGGSRTTDSSDLYGGSYRAYQRYKMGIEHLKDIESAFFFGARVENTTIVAGRPTRSTGGIDQFVTSNIKTLDSNGLDSTTDLEDFLRLGFRYGSSTKFLFASPICIQKISELALSKIFTMPKEETFGLAITQYISSHGVVNLIKSKLFEGNGPTAATAILAGLAYLIDIENLAYRFMDDTFLRTNIQSNDADGWADEYLTEAGLQCGLEKTHAVLKNADGG